MTDSVNAVSFRQKPRLPVLFIVVDAVYICKYTARSMCSFFFFCLLFDQVIRKCFALLFYYHTVTLQNKHNLLSLGAESSEDHKYISLPDKIIRTDAEQYIKCVRESPAAESETTALVRTWHHGFISTLICMFCSISQIQLMLWSIITTYTYISQHEIFHLRWWTADRCCFSSPRAE